MAKKLAQVIATEADAKKTMSGRLTELLRVLQHPELFGGMTKTYTPLNENDERLPPDSKRVQARMDDVFTAAKELWNDGMSITFTKDRANCDALADVEVDGVKILEQVPVTFLLYLEKRLQEAWTFFGAIPVLDEGHDWDVDAQGLYRSAPTQTSRTKKLQKPIVLYEATPDHPAQTQLITEDQVVGHYETVHTSGAITQPRRQALLRRITKLQRAVKEAREAANRADAPEQSVQNFVDYMFGED